MHNDNTDIIKALWMCQRQGSKGSLLLLDRLLELDSIDSGALLECTDPGSPEGNRILDHYFKNSCDSRLEVIARYCVLPVHRVALGYAVGLRATRGCDAELIELLPLLPSDHPTVKPLFRRFLSSRRNLFLILPIWQAHRHNIGGGMIVRHSLKIAREESDIRRLFYLYRGSIKFVGRRILKIAIARHLAKSTPDLQHELRILFDLSDFQNSLTR